MRCFALMVIIFLAGCARYPGTRDTTNAVLWVQTAAEYELTLRQTFSLATWRLDEALSDGPESPAIIVDLDETLLDNSTFEARLIAEDRPFDMEAWRAWLSGTEARAMPGALSFIASAQQRGVAVFFVTNRHERYRSQTLTILRRLGFIDEDEDASRLLMRQQQPDWTSDKTSRRELVEGDHRVVLIVGNDLNDFVACGDLGIDARRALARENVDRFGRDWIMIPSPTWGSWMEALHDHHRDLSDDAMRSRHLTHLRLE